VSAGRNRDNVEQQVKWTTGHSPSNPAQQSQSLATLMRQWRGMSYPTAILHTFWHSLNSVNMDDFKFNGVEHVSTNKLSLSQMSDKRFVDTAHLVFDMVSLLGFSEAPVRYSIY
jgi:hypothetical protein